MRAGSLCAREPAEHLLSLLLRALRGGAGMGERGHVVHGGLGAKRREAARLTSAVTPRLGGVGARQAYGAGGASQNLPRCCSAIDRTGFLRERFVDRSFDERSRF